RLCLFVDDQIINALIDVVGHIDDIPNKWVEQEELLRYAVRNLAEIASLGSQPEANSVLAQGEPLWTCQRNVQLFMGGRCHQGEVEKQLTLVARMKISLELGEIPVSGDVTNLH